MADKPNYELPTSQVDLEARMESGNASTRVLSTSDEYARRQVGTEVTGRDFAVEGNDKSNYVGTDNVYQTYANETEQPLRGEGDGPEVELEKALLDDKEEVPGEPDSDSDAAGPDAVSKNDDGTETRKTNSESESTSAAPHPPAPQAAKKTAGSNKS